jgi:hypothetical protein
MVQSGPKEGHKEGNRGTFSGNRTGGGSKMDGKVRAAAIREIVQKKDTASRAPEFGSAFSYVAR